MTDASAAFETITDSGQSEAHERLAAVATAQDLERTRRAVEAVGEAAYHWVIESDEIFWSGNAANVIGCQPRAVSSGKAFASYLDADNVTSRYDAVMQTGQSDEGQGVPFQIEYLFRPEGRGGRQAVWFEDAGRWFAGADGRPAEVYGIIRRVDDRHKRDQHLNFLGNCDPLTGMMNRGRMAEALGEAISVAERENKSCAFLIAGIRNLAVVNDAYGFEIADEVIIAVGRRLRQVVRTGDAIARYSGSKFGIILNNCNEEEVLIAAERFLSVARDSVIETERGPVWAMLSIGGLVLPKHAEDANMAMARAEEALTEAKRQPSDGFSIYQQSQRRLSERGLNARCATEIVSCLKEDRFRLAYQPIVDAKSGLPAMYEALLRMEDHAGELIAAAHLVPIAEKLGLVRLIDRSVVQMAISALLTYPDACITFNVSGITATDPRWFSQLTDILAVHRSVNNRLTVEITETVALSDLEETARFTQSLRELGCLVAIDDFGAGYTSFRNLKSLNVDILKLDGSFCQDLRKNSDNEYFVRSLIELARKFELKTIAEWVQQPEDAELLRAWGVDYLQGNLFGAATLDVPWKQSGGIALGFEAFAAGVSAPLANATPAQAPAKPPTAFIEPAWPVATDPDRPFTTDTVFEPEALAPAPSLVAASPAVEAPTETPAGAEPAEAAITTAPAPPPAADPVLDFDVDFSQLRNAIEALNQQFTAPKEPKPGVFEDILGGTLRKSA